LKTIAIIPARSGSKRIPGKNIRHFFGKPIIAYSIETALKSGLFDEVMVSTDSLEIVEVAKSYGAQVPFLRSAKNSDDYATTVDVVNEVIDAYKKNGKEFEILCVIYPTAPLISAKHLNEGFEALHKYDAAVPVCEFTYPVWRAFKVEGGNLTYHWPENEYKRSQDLEKLYHDAGQWYWIHTNKLKKTLFPPNTAAILIDTMEVQDIDTEQDWLLAELKYKLKTGSI
jgi:pseudaminic acid cytidylyltransferase